MSRKEIASKAKQTGLLEQSLYVMKTKTVTEHKPHHFVTRSISMKNVGKDKIYMFQREPRKWRTQELSLAPLFQPKFSITTPRN